MEGALPDKKLKACLGLLSSVKLLWCLLCSNPKSDFFLSPSLMDKGCQ